MSETTKDDWTDFWEGPTPDDLEDLSRLDHIRQKLCLRQDEIERLIALVHDNNQYEDDPEDVAFWNNIALKLSTLLSY